MGRAQGDLGQVAELGERAGARSGGRPGHRVEGVEALGADRDEVLLIDLTHRIGHLGGPLSGGARRCRRWDSRLVDQVPGQDAGIIGEPKAARVPVVEDPTNLVLVGALGQ